VTPTRSVLERFAALILAGGVLFSSSVAGVHDPGCPHHAGGQVETGSSEHRGHVPGSASGPSAAAVPDASSGAHEHHGADPDAEDCRCLGGLCALSAVVDPPLPSAGPVEPAVVSDAETLPPPAASAARAAPSHLLPPATGPPLRI